MDGNEWIESTPEELAELRQVTLRAIRERPQLRPDESEAGWRDDPSGSGLRWNDKTGEFDDSLFVHVAPRRPRTRPPDTPNGAVVEGGGR